MRSTIIRLYCNVTVKVTYVHTYMHLTRETSQMQSIGIHCRCALQTFQQIVIYPDVILSVLLRNGCGARGIMPPTANQIRNPTP